MFRLDERLSAAAYKHSTAHVLHQLGVIRSPETHPECKDLRDANEGARMKEALLGAVKVEKAEATKDSDRIPAILPDPPLPHSRLPPPCFDEPRHVRL